MTVLICRTDILEKGQQGLIGRTENLEKGQTEIISRTDNLGKGQDILAAGQKEKKELIKHTTTTMTENLPILYRNNYKTLEDYVEFLKLD
jgi:hypothetical protein